MKRRVVLTAVSALAMAAALPLQAATSIHVFKNPDCGCCSGWVDHLKAAGFAVQVTEVDDTAESRKRLGMPEKFGSCHTATVEGYVLEGHVPAADIRRLLAMRPKALGLAVPGMPVGSPGMEMGPRKDPFQVLLVSTAGKGSVFSTYPK
jgi:hypothetical protein